MPKAIALTTKWLVILCACNTLTSVNSIHGGNASILRNDDVVARYLVSGRLHLIARDSERCERLFANAGNS